MNSPTDQHRGITLLEILISIGVLSIGLLGVLALLPAASQQAKAGAMQDAASVMGRRAFREMNVRWQGSDEIYVSFDGVLTGPNRIAADRFYCIDPLGALLNETVPTPSIPLVKLISQTPLAGVPSANRVVLGQPTASGAMAPYGRELLDMVFRSKDDLDFGEPASRENPAPNPPQQVALKASGPDGTIGTADDIGAKRVAEGGLSWFATVVAKNSSFNTVSVAVVDKRTAIANSDGSTVGAISEQLLGHSMQGGTGEIVISMPALVDPGSLNASLTPDQLSREEIWSAVKPGHWILLARMDANEATVPTPANDTAEWYRIQSIGPFDSDLDGADDSRAITVVGNTWTADIANTRAIVVPNVIAVYSRSAPR